MLGLCLAEQISHFVVIGLRSNRGDPTVVTFRVSSSFVKGETGSTIDHGILRHLDQNSVSIAIVLVVTEFAEKFTTLSVHPQDVIVREGRDVQAAGA